MNVNLVVNMPVAICLATSQFGLPQKIDECSSNHDRDGGIFDLNCEMSIIGLPSADDIFQPINNRRKIQGVGYMEKSILPKQVDVFSAYETDTFDLIGLSIIS